MELKINGKRNTFPPLILKNLYFCYLVSTNYKIYIFIFHRIKLNLFKKQSFIFL